jgi:hypothetical protein
LHPIDAACANYQVMSSLCIPSVAKKIVQKEKELAKVRYPLVFGGLWSVNILIALFGLPFFVYRALRKRT